MYLFENKPENLSKMKAQYDKEGFIQIKKFFSQDDLKVIEKELAGFCKDTAPKLSGRDINYTSSGEINSIHALSQNSTFFKNLLSSKKVLDLVSHFLNDDAEPRVMEFFAKPAKVGMPSPMHQDNLYWCIADANGLTAWIALDHCDETNGGLTYYSGTHKDGIIEHMNSYAPGSSQTIKDLAMLRKIEDKRVTPVLEPGDVLIHHANLIHGSAANTSDRSRRGITMQFKGKHSEYDKNMLAHYEAKLYEQIKLREEQKQKI